MLTERYASRILGVLSCFDRILLTGTLPDICHADAFTRELNRRHVRIFDYTKFATPLRDAIRDNAERLAEEHGLVIEHIRRIKAFRKEDRVQQILAERGTHPGLVHIFSAMETCVAFKPWPDKRSGKTFLKSDSGKCLHYYFYFIDPDLGLCHLRVPTWAPFRLQGTDSTRRGASPSTRTAVTPRPADGGARGEAPRGRGRRGARRRR